MKGKILLSKRTLLFGLFAMILTICAGIYANFWTSTAAVSYELDTYMLYDDYIRNSDGELLAISTSSSITSKDGYNEVYYPHRYDDDAVFYVLIKQKDEPHISAYTQNQSVSITSNFSIVDGTKTDGYVFLIEINIKAINICEEERFGLYLNDYRFFQSETFSINKTPAIYKAPRAKTLTYTGSAQALVDAGTASGGTMYYALGYGSEWTTSIPTATDAGTYTVYYCVVGDDCHVGSGAYGFTVTISKANPTWTNPTAKTLTYTGAAQALVDAGTASGGTLYYKLSDGSYSTSIPMATYAGNYKVYYYIKGDSNHNDITEGYRTVTISKATPTMTKPTLTTNLTYDGAAKTLFTAGSTTGGTIKYGYLWSRTANSTYASDDYATLSSTSVLTGTSSGYYYIYAGVTGNDNYNDVSRQYVGVVNISDTTKPTATITANTTSGKTQSVTLTLSDNELVAGYYWGTTKPSSSSSFTSVTQSSSKTISKTISSAATYYLAAKDVYGNTSVNTVVSIACVGLTLKTDGGTAVFNSSNETDNFTIYKVAGTMINLPAIVSKEGFTFDNWDGYTGVYQMAKTESLTAQYHDSEAPSVKITANTDKEDTKQKLKLEITDNVGVVSYYFGTKASPLNSDYAELDSMTSFKMELNVSESGTYYLFAKDDYGNTNVTSVDVCEIVLKDDDDGMFSFGENDDVNKLTVYRAVGETVHLPVSRKDGGFTNDTWESDSSSYEADSDYEVSKNAELNVHYYDSELPETSLEVVESDDVSQKVSLSATDNVGVTGYYFGKTASPTKDDMTELDESTKTFQLTKNVKEDGVYYFATRDAYGNISKEQSVTVYSTTLEMTNTGSFGGGSFEYNEETYTYNSEPLTITKAEGTEIVLPTPSYDGYTFTGWGEDKLTGNTIPTETQTLTVNWELNTYQITYDLAGGYLTKENPTTYTVETESFTLNNPKRIGYKFKGWKKEDSEEDASVSYTIEKGTFGDMEMLATWNMTYSYDVTSDTLTFYMDDEAAYEEAYQAYSTASHVILMNTVESLDALDLTKFKNLSTVTVSGENSSYASEDGILYNTDKTKLLYCPAAHTDNPTIANTTEEIAEKSFDGCTKITEITLPYSVKKVDENAFTDACKNLDTITVKNPATEIEDNGIPTGITIKAFKDSEAAAYCSSNGVTCHYFTSIPDGFFENEEQMESFTVPDNITSIGENAFSGCSNLTSIDLGNVQTIGKKAFAGTALTDVEIPDTVTEIGEKAFYNSALETLEFEEDSSLVSIGENAFAKNSLETVTIPESVATVAAGTFDDNPLEVIKFEGMDTEIVYDESNPAFPNDTVLNCYYGSKLYEYAKEHGCPIALKIGYDTDGLTVYERDEDALDNLVSVEIGSNLKEISEDAFRGAENLKEVTFDDNSSLEAIGSGAFENTGVTDIDLPDSVKEIGEDCFKNCKSLESINLGGVTSVPDGAFDGCVSLETIKGTEQVTDIGERAFAGTALTEFIGGKDLKSVGSEAFIDSSLQEFTSKNPNTEYAVNEDGTSSIFPDDTKLTGYAGSTTTNYGETYLNGETGSLGKTAYPMTFDFEGGDKGTESIYVVNGVALPTITIPVREDYNFMGYYTSRNGKGTQYFDADGLPVHGFSGSSSITLYAYWIHEYYTVSFDGNGADDGEMEDVVYDTKTEYVLPKNGYVRDGYKFLGWSTTKTAKSPDFADKDSVKDLEKTYGKVTLYAVWKSAFYTVNYHANGGTGTMLAQTIKSDSRTALSLNTFTKENATFLGWSELTDAENPQYLDGQKVKNIAAQGETINLYAVWSDGEKTGYRIIFDANGGTMTATTIVQYEGYESEVPETDVSRDGFEFKGWSLSAVASESEYDTGSKLDDFGEDTVLYAVWDTDGDTDYTVTVHIQNADKTYKETRKETHYADYGTSVTYLENTDFEVPNYYHVDVAKSELTITAGEDDGIDIWLARNKASLIYDLNAADATTQEELSKVTDIWGTEITLDSVMPERENYVFKGWSLDAESDDTVSSAVISPTGITVYAVWVEKKDSSVETLAPTVEPTETPTEAPSQTPAATETPVVTEEPTPAPTSSASSTPKPENVTKTTTDPITPPDTLNTSAKDGSSQLKKGNVIYKVSGKSAVAYRAAKKTVKKVTILNKVKIDGKNYNVTSISKNAFKGCKKLKSVNIKTVKLTSIGKNAFSGCKNLKTITIKSLKLKKVGKNAFKGISKKAAFKVPKKKIKAYKKRIAKKSTGYKKTMKIKK